MKSWLEIAGAVLLCVLMVGLGVGVFLLSLAVYGAFFGAIGAGAYLVFKALVAAAGF